MDMLRMPTASSSRSAVRRRTACLAMALGLLAGGWALSAQAFFLGGLPGFYVPQTYHKFGAVYTRTIVPGPTGRPVYVEYDTSGKEAREIGEAVGQFERAKLMSADTFRAYLKQQEDIDTRYPTSQVMSAADYRGKTFKTVGGATINKKALAPSTLTVTVRADKELFDVNGNDLLLLELPIKNRVTPSSSSKSLLLSEEGNILAETANTIGFRVGFFGKDGKVSETMNRDANAKIYGPMPGVKVDLGGFITGGVASTDSEGKYKMRYFLPACPGFFFEFTTPAYLELQYKRFNPRGGSHMVYYMTKPDYDTCNGLGLWSLDAAMVVASIATPVKRAMDFPVDLMVLDGTTTLQNAKIGDVTEYSAETSDRKKTLQEKYDFDGDEKPETVVPGKKVKKTINGVEKEVFVTTSVEEAELQGIYLSSRNAGVPANTEEDGPDFTRLIDVAADFQNRGLLQSISKEDLKDTDIYVFRESNGQLVAERRGLHEDELYKNYSGVDESAGAFRYTIQLRGSTENYYSIAGRTGEANFAKWQSAGGFKEEFQKRSANHLKAGEQVRIIAINRPTGYIGSARIQLKSSLTGNSIDVNDQQIVMGPPKLKIWAERKNKIEKGMTKGELKKQLIGNEGAGLGSDISIAIYTDWTDSDGSPLPEELADYGYTGRLAAVVSANRLAPAGANSLSQFKIKPGQQVQVIRLPEQVLGKQHLYLQVAGQPENRNPDFSTGSGKGILQYRPKHYVPVIVPVNDEEASEISRQAYRKVRDANPQLDLKKPEPIYQWVARPEMQFSLYELNLKEVRRKDYADKVTNALNQKTPSFASSDTYIGIVYDLLKSAAGALESWAFEGEQQLVFAFGEQEVKATIGKDQNLAFENIEHLAKLDPEDFLTMRLYANNDVNNVLMEFAFEHLDLQSSILGYNDQNDDTWYVTADDPTVPLRATLLGYADRNPKIKRPLTLSWKVEGDGSMATPTQNDSDLGIFSNTLTLPNKAGSKAVVRAMLRESETEAAFKKVEVLPGKPASIDIVASGKAAAMESDRLSLTVTVKDASGNPVADGTSVDMGVNQDALMPEYQPSTVNGVATVTLTGNAFAVPDAKLTAKSGTIIKEFDFAVEGLTVKLDGSPSQFLLGQEGTAQVVVTTSSGKPAAGVLVTVSSDLGYFKESQYETDASGRITPTFFAGQMTGPGKWKVRAGFAGGTEHSFTVKSPEGGGASEADVRDLMVLGDRPNGGAVTYNRYDGTAINLEYETQGDLSVKGAAGRAVQVRLGDMSDPNLEPLLAYYMNDLEDAGLDDDYPNRVLSDVPDELGLHTGVAFDVTVARDNPLGRGTSYEFDGTSKIELKAASTVQKGGQTGFRIDFKAVANGEIFNLGGGQRLSFSGTTLRYEVDTDGGTFSVEKPAVSLNSWHSVGGRYVDGQLELEVDGTKVASAATGTLQYTSGSLLLGQGFKGKLNSFKLYDWNAQPLVKLPGDAQQTTLTLPASGTSNLAVQSTGQLGALQSGSSLRAVRVAITVDGVRQFVSVLSTKAYIELAGQYLDSSADAPPINVAGLQYQPLPWYAGLTIAPLEYMIPKAYAEESSGVWGFLKAAVNFLIPLEDFKVLGEQLYYLATGDWEKFDAVQLTLAALGVSTVFPVMKPLKLVLAPIQRFVKLYGKNPIVKALAAVVGRAAEEAAKGRTEKLVALLPYLLTVVEMLESPDGPAAILSMVEAIESPDDLWGWIEYFTMPTEGWEGDEMPSVALNATARPDVDRVMDSAVEFFVPMALAKKKTSANRADGKKMADALAAATKAAGSPKDLSALFKELVKTLKDPSASPMRKLVHSKALVIAGLGAIKGAGVSAVKGMVSGRPDDRVSRPLLAAVITHIQTREMNGSFPKTLNKEKIWTLYGLALVSNNPTQRHGGTFQLMMLAYLDALNEFAQEPAVRDLEAVQNIVYITPEGKKMPAYERRVDIVLGTDKKQEWYEVKSLLNARYIPSGFKAKSSYHREFYADLLASYGLIDGVEVKASWRFHAFTSTDKKTSGPTSAQFSKFGPRKYLCEPMAEVSPNLTLEKPLLIEDALQKACNLSQNVALMNNRTIIKDVLTSKVFTDEFKEVLEKMGGLDD